MVTADVAEDASVFFFLEKPIGSGWCIQAVRAGAEGLHHLADHARGDQLAGAHGAFHMQALGEINGVFLSRSFTSEARLCELLQSREGRFIGEVILARLHDSASERTALVRHGGGRNQAHLRILKNFLERAGWACAGKLLNECGNAFGNGIENPFDDSTRLNHSIALSVDVPVIEVGRRHNKFPWLANRRGFANGRVCHSISRCHRIQ